MPQKLNASLVMVNLPSNNVAKSRDFFEKLLGIDLVRNLEDTESYHTPISEDGIDLQVGPPRHPQQTPALMFHVDDLDAALRQVNSMGGKVLFGPQDIDMSDRAFKEYEPAYRKVEPGGPQPTKQLGRMACIEEPGGSSLYLMQTAEHLHKHFQVGKDQKPLAAFQEQHRKSGMENARKLFGAVPGTGP